VSPLTWEALEGFRLKFEAARQHMQGLQQTINGFFEENLEVAPIIGEPNSQRTQYLFRIESVIDYPSREWGIVLGEAVHDLRSGLDQLAWAFAKKGSDSTAFPICATEREWVVDAPARYWSCPPGFIRFLDSVQPYHRGDVNEAKKHPLWILNALSNLDKHRTIPATALVADGGEAEIIRFEGILSKPLIHFYSGVPFEKGKIVAKARIKPDASGRDPYIDAKFSMTFDVGFGQISSAPSISFKPVEWVIWDIVQFVFEIGDKMSKLWNQIVESVERATNEAE
jgi:hypothetical protein